MNNLVIFHQCYNQRNATDFAIQQFTLHNPYSKYYLISDGGDDYLDIANKYNVEWFYEDNITMNIMNGETAIKVINRLKKYFEISGCEYLLLMEDDIWCRGKIDFDFDFNAMGANSTGNLFHSDVLQYVCNQYNIEIKNNYFNLCGGSILNGEIFFNYYDKIYDYLLNHHDKVRDISIGKYDNWEYGGWDSTLNMLYNICEKEVIINPELTETWRDSDWKINNKKLVHWYKSYYTNGESCERFYL